MTRIEAIAWIDETLENWAWHNDVAVAEIPAAHRAECVLQLDGGEKLDDILRRLTDWLDDEYSQNPGAADFAAREHEAHCE